MCVCVPPSREGREEAGKGSKLPGLGWRGPSDHKGSFASRSNQSLQLQDGGHLPQGPEPTLP